MRIWMMVIIWILLSYLATLVTINLNENMGIPVTPDSVGKMFFLWPFLLLYFIYSFITTFIGSMILTIHGREVSVGDNDE